MVLEIEAIKKKYKSAKDFCWAQEEPENYGAWPFFRHWFELPNLKGLYRRASSAPATGFHKSHIIEQNEIVESAFKLK